MPVSRQLRLTEQDRIRQTLRDVTGQKANIVLRDGRVILAEIVKVSDEAVTVRNMRLKTVRLNFSDINEVYLDKKASC